MPCSEGWTIELTISAGMWLLHQLLATTVLLSGLAAGSSGAEPLHPEYCPEAYSSEDVLLVTETDQLYRYLRLSFSKAYEAWPSAIYYPIRPVILANATVDQGLLPEVAFVPTSLEDHEAAVQRLGAAVQCLADNDNFNPYTARSGGHNNAGASSQTAHWTMDTRGLAALHAGNVHRGARPAHWSPAEVVVGTGVTAGRAAYLTFDDLDNIGGLPVGQKPSVGMAGLTLGGGFGFASRYAGLLCDRLVSLTVVVPDTGDVIVAEPAGEHSDLFWASCGGGGGNFGVVTDFTFATMSMCWNEGPSESAPDQAPGQVCGNVTRVDYEWENPTLEQLQYYQSLSLALDTRITLNLEVTSATTVMVAGYFFGNVAQWEEALRHANCTEDSPIPLRRLLEHSHFEDYVTATLQLSGWTPNATASALLRPFLEERTYFRYASFFLTEEPSEQLLELLMALPVFSNDGGDYVVYEFQALGGDPEGARVPGYEMYTNNFSRVDPRATAFPQRNARHCLMLKAQAATEEVYYDYLAVMINASTAIRRLLGSSNAYYNHMDPALPDNADLYFVNGSASLWSQGVLSGAPEPRYWVERMASVKARYNQRGLLDNYATVQPAKKTPTAVVALAVVTAILALALAAVVTYYALTKAGSYQAPSTISLDRRVTETRV